MKAAALHPDMTGTAASMKVVFSEQDEHIYKRILYERNY